MHSAKIGFKRSISGSRLMRWLVLALVLLALTPADAFAQIPGLGVGNPLGGVGSIGGVGGLGGSLGAGNNIGVPGTNAIPQGPSTNPIIGPRSTSRSAAVCRPPCCGPKR